MSLKSLSGRNRTSDPVIADIYSHMLYQLSYAEAPGSNSAQHPSKARPTPIVCALRVVQAGKLSTRVRFPAVAVSHSLLLATPLLLSQQLMQRLSGLVA